MNEDSRLPREDKLHRLIFFSGGLLAVFLLIASSLPVKDRISQALYPKNESGAASGLAGCDYTVEPGVTRVDGNGNFAKVKPGQTICMAPGGRGPVTFVNLNGVSGAPIVLRNADGVVTISGTEASAGIVLTESTYVRISGAGASQRCGAEYSQTSQDCGIVIFNTLKGIEASVYIDHVEIDHVEIHNTLPIGVSASGIHVSDSPGNNRIADGVFVHHTYIHDIQRDGVSVGDDEIPGGPVAFRLKNVELSYNFIQNMGWNGISIKHATEQVRAHHNYIDTTGVLRRQDQGNGILLVDSVGDYHSNRISQSGASGIRSFGGQSGQKMYNNIVVGSAEWGMHLSTIEMRLYNNTLANNAVGGVSLRDGGGSIFDNIIVGSPDEIRESDLTESGNNVTGEITDAGFTNFPSNLMLRADSPAVDAGRSDGMFPPTDIRGVARPQGVKTDVGAYEFEQ